MDAFRDILEKTMQAKGLTLEEAVLTRFCRHFDLLRQANAEFNLTAITEFSAAAEKHYLDSLFALDAMADMAMDSRFLDIGSGAGFPGLVLAIAQPDMKFTLLEATGKKCGFLERCVDELGLKNVVVQNLRAEDAAGERRRYAALSTV